MRISDGLWFSRAAAIFICLCLAHGFALGQGTPYVVANNDAPFSNGLSFYTIGATGLLSLKQQVLTEGAGIWSRLFRDESAKHGQQRRQQVYLRR